MLLERLVVEKNAAASIDPLLTRPFRGGTRGTSLRIRGHNDNYQNHVIIHDIDSNVQARGANRGLSQSGCWPLAALNDFAGRRAVRFRACVEHESRFEITYSWLLYTFYKIAIYCYKLFYIIINKFQKCKIFFLLLCVL